MRNIKKIIPGTNTAPADPSADLILNHVPAGQASASAVTSSQASVERRRTTISKRSPSSGRWATTWASCLPTAWGRWAAPPHEAFPGDARFLRTFHSEQKTQAFHRLQDDVPAEVKRRRLEECISVFRQEALKVNAALIGSSQLVLVEGVSVTGVHVSRSNLWIFQISRIKLRDRVWFQSRSKHCHNSALPPSRKVKGPQKSCVGELTATWRWFSPKRSLQGAAARRLQQETMFGWRWVRIELCCLCSQSGSGLIKSYDSFFLRLFADSKLHYNTSTNLSTLKSIKESRNMLLFCKTSLFKCTNICFSHIHHHHQGVSVVLLHSMTCFWCRSCRPVLRAWEVERSVSVPREDRLTRNRFDGQRRLLTDGDV